MPQKPKTLEDLIRDTNKFLDDEEKYYKSIDVPYREGGALYLGYYLLIGVVLKSDFKEIVRKSRVKGKYSRSRFISLLEKKIKEIKGEIKENGKTPVLVNQLFFYQGLLKSAKKLRK